MQFYTGNDDDILLCHESKVNQTAVTVTGLEVGDRAKIRKFTGVVQWIEEDNERDLRRRWRVGMTGLPQSESHS